MKKILFLILAFMSINAFSQITVKEGSFRYVEDGLMLDKKTDDNDKPMALIVISTENISQKERRRFQFSGSGLTYTLVEEKPGALHLYLTAKNTTFIKMVHPDYGSCTLEFDEKLKDYGCYEVTVVSAYQQKEEDKPNVSYLTISTDQLNSMIFIDGEFVGTHDVSKLLTVGETHKWNVECDLYHSESGEVVLSNGESVEKEVFLRPAYGYINVTSSPEDGAVIYVDNKKVGETPYMSDKMMIGTHKIVVFKDTYKPYSEEIELSNDIFNMNIELVSNLAKVEVKTDSLSYIYIDNEMKGIGEWKGNIPQGTHLFEARRPSHKTTYYDDDFDIGESKTIVLETPKPIYGKINVVSNPEGASIYVDGEYKGLAPKELDNLLVGEHELRLKKEGYATMIKKVYVAENNVLKEDEVLSLGKDVTIKTDKDGDRLYVDKQYLGESPQTIGLPYGPHSVTIERGNHRIIKDIDVKVSSSCFDIIFGKEVVIKTDNPSDILIIDGKEIDGNPCTMTLSYGIHNLQVKNGSKELDTRTIDIDNDSDNLISVNLRRKITIKTLNNGDMVFVDNAKRPIGSTPLTTNMYLGKHVVKVVNKKDNKKVATKNIDVKEHGGEDTHTLYYGQLVKIGSNKDGDAVFVDGKKLGNTPLDLDLEIGKHEVMVKRHRKFHKETLILGKGHDTEFMFFPVRETVKQFNNCGVKFFTFNASPSINNSGISYGLSFGSYTGAGWFISAMTNVDMKDGVYYTAMTQIDPDYVDYINSYEGLEFVEDSKVYSKFSIMGGMMFRMFGPTYLKIGAGYGSYMTYQTTINEELCKMKDESYNGLLLTAGLQFNMKNIIMSADIMSDPDFETIGLKLGFGFGWKK